MDQFVVRMIKHNSNFIQTIMITPEGHSTTELLLTCPPRTSTMLSLLWRHNGQGGVSNHQPHDCLLNRLFGCISKKTSKLRVTGLCAGNSPGTGEFPAQMASNAENVSIWWRHHGSQWKTMTTCHRERLYGECNAPNSASARIFIYVWRCVNKNCKLDLTSTKV